MRTAGNGVLAVDKLRVVAGDLGLAAEQVVDGFRQSYVWRVPSAHCTSLRAVSMAVTGVR
jgi:hypothetical protein